MIELAESDNDILACYSLMRELRPDIDKNEWLVQVRLQMAEGYKLVYLEDEGLFVSLAGFRIRHSLAWGRFMYVDDLVTRKGSRSLGYGEKLFLWLKNYASKQDCKQLHLDSGIQRKNTHRFYENQDMEMSCLHFHIPL